HSDSSVGNRRAGGEGARTQGLDGIPVGQGIIWSPTAMSSIHSETGMGVWYDSQPMWRVSRTMGAFQQLPPPGITGTSSTETPSTHRWMSLLVVSKRHW